MKVSAATKSLHKKDLAACKKAALKHWDAEFVSDICNLSWNVKSLEDVGRQQGASKLQTDLLVDLHNAAKLEFAGFAVSRMSR